MFIFCLAPVCYINPCSLAATGAPLPAQHGARCSLAAGQEGRSCPRLGQRLCAASRGGRGGRWQAAWADQPNYRSERDPAVHDKRRTSGRGSGAPTRRCAAQRARRGAPRKRGPHGRLPERGRERLEHREEEDSPQSGAYARTWVNPDRRVLRPECGKRQKMILFCPKAPGCRVPHYTPTGFNPQWIR